MPAAAATWQSMQRIAAQRRRHQHVDISACFNSANMHTTYADGWDLKLHCTCNPVTCTQ
jgi:hypothetical protein